MTVEAIDYEVRKFLADQSTVNTIVEARLYPMMLPQNPVLPAITIQLTGTRGIDTHDDAGGIKISTLQIDSWGSTHTSVKLLAKAVRGVLNGYSGTLDTQAAQNIVFKNELDLFDPETEKYRVVQFWEVWHTLD